ncbi:excinuclease ABC subunit UvrA [Schlesneria paludicola]|uniref:excinuclease ABC subunit UvrA n=1 Tax=Schlesneria paludicola TaxID=360056 RepID=UPI00029AFBF4|nr:excinuclease ABC subunit UvrA [Schlesneria paludicola]
MPASDIVIRGAREHNLQDVSLTLPRNQLIVMTGVSGSGKSSLAFDTLYAEGQRRYVESLSSYARQFLGQMPKPDVDSITGLAPSISIQQKASGRNPRSTVGTITEIYDYLRVLFARVSTPACYQCGRPITAQTQEQILDRVLRLPEGTKYSVLAPLITRQKGEFKDLFVDLLKRGFLRARVDGKLVQLTDDLQLDKQMKHTIDVVVDRLVAGKSPRSRVAEAIEAALNLAERKLVIAREPNSDSPIPLDESHETQPTGKPTKASKKRNSKAASARSTDLIVSDDDGPPDDVPTTLDELYSCDYACMHCGISYDQPSPQLFSFNSPQGMCPDCQGLGIRYDFAMDRLVPDDTLTIQKGALVVLGKLSSVGKWRKHILKGVARAIEVDLGLAEDSFFKTKWKDLPLEGKKLFLYGLGSRNITFAYRSGNNVWKRGGTYAGFIPELLDEYRKTRNPMRRVQLEKYMHETGCASCAGTRLNHQARSYRITSHSAATARDERRGLNAKQRSQSEGVDQQTTIDSGSGSDAGSSSAPLALSLPEVCSLSTLAAWDFFGNLELTDTGRHIATEALKEIRGRLGFLLRCGLDYLTLDRTAPTLSGGETQRIRLAGQIGCGLVGVVYILDEPSIGLHPRDNVMLLDSLKDLRDQGNTVIVVEHDDETMKAADFMVDFGPGPGVRGGEIVAQGSVEDVKRSARSLTGAFLSGRRAIEIPKIRRPGNGQTIEIQGATHHNLRDVTVHFPLGKFICVTGVSGSGKSSLVNDILWEVLNRDVNKGAGKPGAHRAFSGLDQIDKAIDIDQTPIGRTPRSNPATYTKLFDLIRELYTLLPESKLRGFKPGRFSFNVPGGRCEACEGNGANKLEMDFLADIWVTCPVCQGKRFNKETLEVHFKGKSINDVLNMDIQQALEHFTNHPKLMKSIQTLHDVGMDYIKLGQPSPTLSGGEAQRVKLAKELSKRSTGKTVYILDEPTTGLHFVDIEHLLRVLHGFVDAGNTVVVVEHNLDVIKTADWVIDLGPEGGSGGGRILIEGTPEDVAACEESHTGRALRTIPGFESITTVAKPRTGKKGKGTKKSANGSPAPATVAESVPRWQTSVALKDSAVGAETSIVVRGASQHNLQQLDLTIPRDKMSVFCGPSGSGKSSLAMDTLYAEGQRRYVESLSAYARQFLGQMPKPRVEHIHGLQPSIAIEQKTMGSTPRSTVGTVTEIYDYLRILFARLGTQYCPDCGIAVQSQTIDDVIDRLMRLTQDGEVSDQRDSKDADQPVRLLILAPQEVAVGQQYSKLWERLTDQGYRRVRIDGVIYTLEDAPDIDRKRKHIVEIVVDRVTVNRSGRSRLAESVESAFDLGKGFIRVAIVDETRDEKKWKVLPYSLFRACESCGRSFEELAPHNFSFNSPLGWCPVCEGIGIQQGTNLAALISDPTRPLSQGAVSAWPDPLKSPLFGRMLGAMAKECDIPLDVPFSQLDPLHQRAVLYGTGETWISLSLDSSETTTKSKSKSASKSAATVRFQYKGLYPAIEQAASLSYDFRAKLYGLVGDVPCSSCNGSRLREDASAVKLTGKTLKQLCDLPLREALEFLNALKMTASQKKIAGDLLVEATSRLRFLVEVGLHYLTLGRTLPTLSGGETQRIRLAGQIGRALTGVLYVLDEPTIGLHPSDNSRLLAALIKLRDLGNTVVMVEHDREVLEAADRLYDFGPGAGRFGGMITAQGSPREIKKSEDSLTGKFLSAREEIVIPSQRRMLRKGTEPAPLETTKSTRKSKASKSETAPTVAIAIAPPSAPQLSVPSDSILLEYGPPPGGGWLELLGARQHNLRNVDLRIPLGTLTAVTGVSGSGKSSLIEDTLARVIARKLHRASTQPGPFDELIGLNYLSKLIVVDQQPLGTTPASNPATYTGVFEHIRDLYARMPEAKVRGYSATRFSFNRAGGRCEACEGNGQKLIEMHFLPDVWVECDTCRGQRYNAETLSVHYRGKTIADVLSMSIGQALELFDNIPKIRGPLSVLAAIGLDYLTLGQPAPTLSGGEAQRVKLAAELSRPQTGKTLYLLDEPTTGLHFDDIRKLLKILNSLVDAGNTVVVIEHNLDVIKTADWIIDLGPHAGSEGGWIVAEGTPEDVVQQAVQHQAATRSNGSPSTKEHHAQQKTRATSSITLSDTDQHRSLTGEILAGVLAAGAVGERETFDAEAARKKKAGDLDPSKIGADAKMPWEVDGRKWHTVDGLANNGRPRRWNGAILSRIVDALEESEQFSATNWNERSTVEIAAKKKSIGWFLHAYSGDEWLVTFKFRVPKKSFEEAELSADLNLKDVNDLDHLPVYNRQPRVRIRPSTNGPFEDVTISIVEPAEIETPSFERFFQTAQKAFVERASSEALNLEDLTPWKKLGRKWHMMRKGFLQGSIEWEPAVLEELVTRLEEILPNAVIDWTQKVIVNFVIDKKPVLNLVTKRPAALDLTLFVPAGAVQLGQIASFGTDPGISSHKVGLDAVRIRFTNVSQVKSTAFQTFLRELWSNVKA